MLKIYRIDVRRTFEFERHSSFLVEAEDKQQALAIAHKMDADGSLSWKRSTPAPIGMETFEVQYCMPASVMAALRDLGPDALHELVDAELITPKARAAVMHFEHSITGVLNDE